MKGNIYRWDLLRLVLSSVLKKFLTQVWGGGIRLKLTGRQAYKEIGRQKFYGRHVSQN